MSYRKSWKQFTVFYILIETICKLYANLKIVLNLSSFVYKLQLGLCYAEQLVEGGCASGYMALSSLCSLSKEAVLRRAAELFAPNASFSVSGQTRAFNCTNPPPQVKISTIVPDAFYPILVLSSELIHLWKDSFAGTSGVLLGRAEE